MAEVIKKLRVTARVEGFRRAGRAWGTEPTEVLASEFNKEQLAALKAERELVVEEIEEPATPAAKAVDPAVKPAAKGAKATAPDPAKDEAKQ